MIGNARFLAESGVETAPLAAEAETLRADGATAIFVASMARRRASSPSPTRSSRRPRRSRPSPRSIRIVMLTGDNRTTAEAVARRLGIDEVEADVLPDRKAKSFSV